MTIISADGRFEWDSDKNEINVRKHGLHFEEILPIFEDPLFLEKYDSEHSSGNEDRYFGIGAVQNVLVVVVSYVEKTRIRMISVRIATSFEKILYERRWKYADCGRN